jgi:hypothetical protein
VGRERPRIGHAAQQQVGIPLVALQGVLFDDRRQLFLANIRLKWARCRRVAPIKQACGARAAEHQLRIGDELDQPSKGLETSDTVYEGAGQLEMKSGIELSGTACADLSQIGHILAVVAIRRRKYTERDFTGSRIAARTGVLVFCSGAAGERPLED